MNAQSLQPVSAILDAVKKSLRLYHKDSKEGAPLRSLRLFQRLRPVCRNDRQATNQILADALEALRQEHPEEARIIEGNYFDGMTMKEVAHRIGLGEAATYVRKARGVSWLAEIIWEAEQMALGHKATGGEDGFPLFPRADEPVVGIDRRVGELWEVMCRPDPPHIVALVGIGGLGKTTLAQVLAQRLVHAGEVAGAAWVSAKPVEFSIAGDAAHERPSLTAEAAVESLHRQIAGGFADLPFSYPVAVAELRAKLRAERYVVVIDNLETLVDLQTLLPFVQTLVDPSKVILTSRESLPGMLTVRHYAVPPLDKGEAVFLLRSHAQNAGLSHLAGQDDAQLGRVFETVGGNPLALRLVVGQSHMHDLDHILRDLTAARGKAAGLYDYVFRRAWENLDEPARVAWLATPTLPPSGGTNEQWRRASGLPDEPFNSALERLVTLNLVDSRISTTDARYSIHSLTRTFLIEGIAGWL